MLAVGRRGTTPEPGYALAPGRALDGPFQNPKRKGRFPRSVKPDASGVSAERPWKRGNDGLFRGRRGVFPQFLPTTRSFFRRARPRGFFGHCPEHPGKAGQGV